MLPTEKAGASWIRTSKMTSRPRRKEPPAGPWVVREAVHICEGRPASEAQSPGKGLVNREWAVSEGTKRKMLKAGIGWVKLSETLQS